MEDHAEDVRAYYCIAKVLKKKKSSGQNMELNRDNPIGITDMPSTYRLAMATKASSVTRLLKLSNADLG